MVVKWSGIWKGLRSMSLFASEYKEVFELRPITVSYLPAVEALDIPQIGKPICWMKMSATNFLVFLHLFWQYLISATPRYAVGAVRRRVFILTAVISRSVMPITPKLGYILHCACEQQPCDHSSDRTNFYSLKKSTNCIDLKYSTNCMMCHMI